MKNKFYENNIIKDVPINREYYDYIVDGVILFRNFTIDDIYKYVKKKAKKEDKKKFVDRYKVVGTLRILIKSKLIYYDLDNMLMKLSNNKNKNKK